MDQLTKADVLAGQKTIEVETLWGEKTTFTVNKIPWRDLAALEMTGREFVDAVTRQSLGPGELERLETLPLGEISRLQQLAMALSVTGVGGLKKVQDAVAAALATASSPSPASKPN